MKQFEILFVSDDTNELNGHNALKLFAKID